MNFLKALAIVLALITISCNTTKLSATWVAPETDVKISNLNKVLVVALFNTETSRRKVEDQMAKYLDQKGVVSYNYLTKDFNKNDEDTIHKLIKADFFDGVVTMRLIDIDKEKVYLPGNNYPNYYRNFGGYYNRNYPFYYQRGYYTTTKTYTVETIVFSVIQDKIIWSGLSKTTNPAGLEKMTDEISNLVFRKMIKQGFVKK